MDAKNPYYAYIHCKPDGTPFYVGKGNTRRVRKLSGRSEWHSRVVNKYGAENILVGKLECSSEALAFELEKGLIKCLRRMGVALINQTDGGEGASGWVATPEYRAKMSAATKGRTLTAAHKAKIAEATRARMARPEERARVSAMMLGSKRTEESKKLISARVTEAASREEVRAKRSAAQKARFTRDPLLRATLNKTGVAPNDVTRAKISAAGVGRIQTEATIEKRKATMALRKEREGK